MAFQVLDEQLDKYAHRLKGAVVIVTGGANGIGRESALRCARFGAKIVIGDLDLPGAKSTRHAITENGGECLIVRCDVTSWEDQVNLFSETLNNFGTINVVIANAGVTESPELGKMVFDATGTPMRPDILTTEVNLVGVIYTTHLAVHHLSRAPDISLKSLILISSMAGLVTLRGAPQYTASKHAILGLMRAIARPNAKLGIKIAAIAPWFVDTALLPSDIKTILSGLKYVPMDRAAGAILYAATEPNAETTGGCVYAIPDGVSPLTRFAQDVTVGGVCEELNARLEVVFGLASIHKWGPRLMRRVGAATLLVIAAYYVWQQRWISL